MFAKSILSIAAIAAAAISFQVSTAEAQPGSRVCLSTDNNKFFVIEIPSDKSCSNRYFYLNGSRKNFGSRKYTCETVGAWGGTDDFGRRDNDICDGMRRAQFRSLTHRYKATAYVYDRWTGRRVK